MRDMRRVPFLLLIAILGYCLPTCSQQKGKASYYSKKATGARTASGERLHHDSLTCAHRFYPFGTWLKVTNLNNQKSVVVRVTDRGPFTRGRVIDLSWGAAKAIDMLRQGVVSVKVEVMDSLQIPLRPKEEFDPPLIDFEMAETGYSFIDRWKNWNTADKTDKRSENKEKQEAPSKNPNNDDNASRQTATSHKKSAPPPQPQKEESQNTWSKVFEKIKNIF